MYTSQPPSAIPLLILLCNCTTELDVLSDAKLTASILETTLVG